MLTFCISSFEASPSLCITVRDGRRRKIVRIVFQNERVENVDSHVQNKKVVAEVGEEAGFEDAGGHIVRAVPCRAGIAHEATNSTAALGGHEGDVERRRPLREVRTATRAGLDGRRRLSRSDEHRLFPGGNLER